MTKTAGASFEGSYPHLSRWVKEFGSLELGYDERTDCFIRVLHPGGGLWKGRRSYRNLDAALKHAEKGAARLLREEFD
jgi:hypothetical protein